MLQRRNDESEDEGKGNLEANPSSVPVKFLIPAVETRKTAARCLGQDRTSISAEESDTRRLVYQSRGSGDLNKVDTKAKKKEKERKKEKRKERERKGKHRKESPPYDPSKLGKARQPF